MIQTDLPRHEAWALAEAASGQRREFLIAHGEAALSLEAKLLFQRLVQKRKEGVPLAYLVGWREFYGRPFWVNPHTLIPRPETELLIDTVLGLPAGGQGPLRICDLGTGSGCIAITLALELPNSQLIAIDLSREALRVARNNAAWLGVSGRIEFRQGDWLEALEKYDGRFHGLISNPPYVAKGDPHLQRGDLRFEPQMALSPTSVLSAGRDAADGLTAIAEIARNAPHWLEPGGFLLVEHGVDQQNAVAALFAQAGLTGIQGLADLEGRPRAVIGWMPV